MCCNPTSGGGGGQITLAVSPLSNVRYVDKGTTVSTGFQNGSILYPYKTLAQAIASITDGTTGTLMITSDDYTAEGTQAIGTRRLSLFGLGLNATTQVTRPSLPNFNGNGLLSATDCQFASLGTSSALSGAELWRSRVVGNILVANTLKMTSSSQAGNVTVNGTGGANVQLVDSSLQGTWNIAGGGSTTNAPQLDEQSFASAMFQGVQRSDANADWNVGHQLFAQIPAGGRTITSIYYGFCIATGTLIGGATVTITQDATLNVGQVFRVDRYDISNNTITVNGSTAGTVNLSNAATVRTRFNLINNAGPTIAFVDLQRLAAA